MRIVYVNIFSNRLVSGGIKVTYRCAEALQDCGYDAAVWQPDGAPDWLETKATIITETKVVFSNDDVLIFPEVMDYQFLNIINSLPYIRKLLFCQNHFNIFNNTVVPPLHPREIGFKNILCVSHVSRGVMERAFGYSDIAVMHPAVDPDIFKPGEKTLQIAFAPRKLRKHADLVRKLFFMKYPDMRGIVWQAIDGLSEAGVAEVLGRSHVYLALGEFESLGLMALEAMSAGCAVVGYHGYGGLEYATVHNGFWHFNDEIEEVVDNLYRTIIGIQRDDPLIRAMIAEGKATAAKFNAGAMRTALVDFIESARK